MTIAGRHSLALGLSGTHCPLPPANREGRSDLILPYKILKGLLFGGSREQDKDVRPLQTGEKTDRPHTQESSRKQSWEKMNKAVCGEAFG